jgi:hypothetical protein
VMGYDGRASQQVAVTTVRYGIVGKAVQKYLGRRTVWADFRFPILGKRMDRDQPMINFKLNEGKRVEGAIRARQKGDKGRQRQTRADRPGQEGRERETKRQGPPTREPGGDGGGSSVRHVRHPSPYLRKEGSLGTVLGLNGRRMG